MFREKTDTSKFFSGPIEIRESPIHGLGVFALEDIPIHVCVEVCPVILFAKELLSDWFKNTRTRHILHDYTFGWRDGGSDLDGMPLGHGVCLGWGSIINHDFENSNVTYRWGKVHGRPSLEFWTIKNVKAGEELLTKYCTQDKEWAWI